eukprot:g1070.t1
MSNAGTKGGHYVAKNRIVDESIGGGDAEDHLDTCVKREGKNDEDKDDDVRDVADILIVGAGISGLICAETALAMDPTLRVIVLEARNRVGGRLYSFSNVDLGAAWGWPPGEAEGVYLAQRLGVAVVPQRLDGNAFAPSFSYSSRGKVTMRCVGDRGGEMAPCGPNAVRFEGGYAELPSRLAKTLQDTTKFPIPVTIRLGTRVSKVERVAASGSVAGELVAVTSADASGDNVVLSLAKRVVLAAPPGVLARCVTFSPPLDSDGRRRQKMLDTSTWCGDWCKIAAVFRTPFWRKVNASGVVAAPRGGPISIWFEGGTGEGSEAAALLGLGFGEAACAEIDRMLRVSNKGGEKGRSELNSFVVSQLGSAFGQSTVERELLRVGGKSWATDDLTFAGSKASGRDYGHELLRRPTSWGLFFAGTETERLHGHVEGAIVSGRRAARQALASLGRKEARDERGHCE